MTRGFRRRRLAFSYVEVVISLGLLVVVMGAFVVALEDGSTGLFNGFARGELTARVDAVLASLEEDVREAPLGMLRVSTEGVPAGQCAVVLPSARDSSGVFHLTSGYAPRWRAVVIYCPFVNAQGIHQLRRYVYFDDAGEFTFPFEMEQITEGEIRLRDALNRLLVMDREHGNTTLPAGREFLVFCPDFSGLAVELTAPPKITVRASHTTRRNVTLAAEGVRYVACRN